MFVKLTRLVNDESLWINLSLVRFIRNNDDCGGSELWFGKEASDYTEALLVNEEPQEIFNKISTGERLK